MDALVRISEVTKRYGSDGHPEAPGGGAAAAALTTQGAAVALARPHEDRLHVSDARCEALFASWLQPSDAPTAEAVVEAISCTVRQLGICGCVGRMAQEFGDHPETAAERMRWVRQVVAAVPATPQPRSPRCVQARLVPDAGSCWPR
jgi:hypothetical protein